MKSANREMQSAQNKRRKLEAFPEKVPDVARRVERGGAYSFVFRSIRSTRSSRAARCLWEGPLVCFRLFLSL